MNNQCPLHNPTANGWLVVWKFEVPHHSKKEEEMRKSILLILVFIAFAKCVETEDLLATPSNKAPQQPTDDEPIVLDEPLDELRDTPGILAQKAQFNLNLC